MTDWPRCTEVQQLKSDKDLALQDIVSEIFHTKVMKLDLSTQCKIFILEQMADLEYRIAHGASEKLQLSALVGIFQVVRKATVQKTDPYGLTSTIADQ